MANRLSVSDAELAQLIDHGESARVEFKESLTGIAPKQIREAISAFANDLPGSGHPGIVVIGLVDKTMAPSDLVVTDELLRTLADMRTDGNIVPPPTLIVEKRRYRGTDIAVVTVTPSDSPPVRCKGLIHVRSGPRRGHATAQDERILNERRRYRDRPFDLYPVFGTTTADLDRRQFEDEYLPNAVSPEALAANDRSFEERLTAAKMIAAPGAEATILGLLTLCRRAKDYIPGGYVQFLRIDGPKLTDPIVDDAVFEGTVSDVVRRLEEKLASHNRRQIDLLKDRLEIRTETYPLEAVQQLVRNAIMHRSYEGTNAPVRVMWFNDRLEIQNPGGAYGGVTAENFGQPGVVDYRNPNLAEAMKVLGIVQRFGIGILIARQLLLEAGHPAPEFLITPTHVMATIRQRAT